jgi:hypothetical protein
MSLKILINFLNCDPQKWSDTLKIFVVPFVALFLTAIQSYLIQLTLKTFTLEI